MYKRQIKANVLPFCLALIVLSAWTCGQVEGIVLCPLTWTPDSYGSVPDGAVGFGSGDYVVRVHHKDGWLVGRMTSSKGKAFVSAGESVFEVNTYDVLTNPTKCPLTWMYTGNGQIPHENAVPVVDERDATGFIGRSMIAGGMLGGRVDKSQGALFQVYEGKQIVQHKFEVLVSSYPALSGQVSFSQVDKPLGRDESKQIIGQNHLKNELSGVEIPHEVFHEKTMIERFDLIEPGVNWRGIGNLSLSFELWYGSSDVTAEFSIQDGTKVLSTKRDITMKSHRTVPVKVGGSPPTGDFEACTTVTVLTTPPNIDVQAEGYFWMEGVDGDEVAEVLRQFGRTVIDVEGPRVKAKLDLHLGGRFITDLYAYTGRRTAGELCATAKL